MINLFPKKKRPYLIYAPSYTDKSSGVRTLHLLCHALNEVGCNAKLLACQDPYYTNPNLNTPVMLENSYEDPIVIYPDIVRGNPMNARRVVRYLLAPAGEFGGDKDFSNTDMIWGALPSLAENVLRIPVSDPAIFHNRNCVREGECFYSHKYEMHGNPKPDGKGVRLEGSLENIARILRSSRVCYLYELSSIITEAALCGCHVELIRTPYFNKIDASCMMGDVRWSDGEVVKKSTYYYPEYYKFIVNFPTQLFNFIEKTQ